MSDFRVIKDKSSFLSENTKLMSLLSNYHKISLPHDETLFSDILCWCLERCKGKFRDIRKNDTRDWYFEKESDAIMFALRWGRNETKVY